MTEAEWLAETEPTPMLEFLRGRASDRQSRHIMVHFAHQSLAWYHDEATRAVIAILDRYADGDIAGEGLHDALLPFAALCRVLAYKGYPWSVQNAVRLLPAHIESAALWLIRPFIPEGITVSSLSDLNDLVLPPIDGRIISYFRWVVCETLRDVVGAPIFRPITFSPAWLTHTAVGLAQAMYATREFGAMPTLADALQNAGCEDADILAHCRGDGPHVRGCWVIDGVLGKG
ncbi:hypothetical protein [Limnoglobus roseus]|uniref:SMI1/KNR4 family protein n=1 Tax=Limnoglobus roseus TaxID=2598579 RepID=A0A5C1AP75_9BACT|nr:hypothetical protein [Limnoglobus roseus]QEL19957.1 SMI1/KNR4 family protein [Limnoglobus roseus]